MPNNLLKKIHEQTGITMQKLEREWKKDKAQVEHQGKPAQDKWAEITSIIEKQTGYKPKKK